MMQIFKKYKIAIITALIVLIIGAVVVIIISKTKNSSLKYVNDNNYALEFDSNWKINNKSDDVIVLKHKSGSRIIIQITKLLDDYKYSSIEELIDEVIYNINEQNTEYNLISQKEDKITKFMYNGYKLLYENDKEQVMVNVYKKSDKLISIRYEADNDYFDILLDSVNNIIYNLDIKEENFNLKEKLNIETTDLVLINNEELDKLLVDSKTYETANNNFYVQYSIPSNFTMSKFDTTSGYYRFKMDDGDITLYFHINKTNMYSYLDKEQLTSVYKTYAGYHKEGSNDYYDFKETLSKLDSKYDSYIYKNTYYKDAIKYNSNFETETVKKVYENAELLYALDNNHTLKITINASGIPITKKLLDMIKINESKNYASYIKVEKDNNMLVGTLQDFTDYSNNKINIVTIKVPDKYEEIDKNNNQYSDRYYGYNYNEQIDKYDYEIHYNLSNLSIDFKIDSVNSIYVKPTYGKSKKLTFSGENMLNNKKFKIYDGGYTDISGIMFTNINRVKYYVNKKILFYELPSGGNLYIEINGNGKKITESILQELINFTIEEKDY